MFIPVALMGLWGIVVLFSPIDVFKLPAANLVAGANGTVGSFILDYMWVIDLLLFLSYLFFAAREILKTFFINPKNAWRPCVAALVFLPWLIPLCDLFRQCAEYSLVGSGTKWYAALAATRLPLPLEFVLLFLIVCIVISAVLWNSWGRAGSSKWCLTWEDIRYNRRINKARGVRKAQVKKMKKQEERNHERQVLREVFLKNKEVPAELGEQQENTQAQEATAAQPQRLDIEALDAALAAEAEKETPDYEKYLRMPPEATSQQLNIRFAIQVVIMILLWFVAMWLCDQVMGVVNPASGLPLVLNVIDIAPFSNFASAVYGAVGLPLMQDAPIGAEWLLDSTAALLDFAANGPLNGLVANIVEQIA
jgi:uncharacterized membrane protein